MKIRSIRREIQILRVYALLSTIAAGAFLLGAVHKAKNASFDTITVHRINLVDNDGALRLAISNKDNFPPPIMHGKPFGIGMRSVGGSPSFVFYNADGDEQGGFRWDGTGRVGGKYSQLMSMSFDQFEQNDDLMLNFSDSNAGRSGGLELQEQSETTPLDVLLREMQAASAAGKTAAEQNAISTKFARSHFVGHDRFFGGYNADGSMVRLSDKEGRPRLLMIVDKAGSPHIEFLDDSGKVTYELPAKTP
jgi:hypothetical protein